MGIRWVGHPVTMLATVVLLVNDHLLKALWPGLVTGKLSDLAGLVVAPAVLAVGLALVAPRVPVGVLAWVSLVGTGVGFAAVKLTHVGAEFASAAWSVVAGPSYVLADPTDLVALPALGLAWWAWRRVADTAPLPEDLVTRVRLFVALPLALLAVTATSAPAEPEAITVVEEIDGAVVIAGTTMPYRSATGTGGWEVFTDAESAAENLGPEPSKTSRQQHKACVPGQPQHCYRVHGGDVEDVTSSRRVPNGGRLLGVDETTDGRTWRTVWQVPPSRWRFLAARHELLRPRDDRYLASVDILVREVPGGHQVFVANGIEGLAVRGPDGTWRRVAVLAEHRGGEPLRIVPLPLTGFGVGLGRELPVAIGLMLLGAVLAGVVVAWRIRRVRRWRSAWWVVIPIVGGLVSLPPLVILLLFDSVMWSLVVVYSLLGFGALLAGLQPHIRSRRAFLLLGALLLVGLGYVAPYLGWSVGIPDEYAVASGWA
ncbi:MAG: hypothetical protein ACRDT6_05825 [Micromonosporaceae bacterium]